MCQRRLHSSQLTKEVILLVFCSLILIPSYIFSQQDSLKITFDFSSISDTTVLGGRSAEFPNPVLSLMTVRDQNNKYIYNLADTTQWLSPDDIALCGIRVDSIWQRIHEYHRD